MIRRILTKGLALSLCLALFAASVPPYARAAEGLPVETSADSFYSLPSWAGALDALRKQPGAIPNNAIPDLSKPENRDALRPLITALQARGLSPEKLRALSKLPDTEKLRVGELISQAAQETAWSANAGLPGLLSSSDPQSIGAYRKLYGPWLSPQAQTALQELRVEAIRSDIALTALALRRREDAGAPSLPSHPSPLITQILNTDHRAIPLRDFTAKLLPDNAASLRENLAILDQAVSRATISTFIWSDDEAGHAVAYAVLRALRRGVKVTLILDSGFTKRADRRMLSNLARAGAEAYMFRPLLKFPLQMMKRMHDKAVWADMPDGRVAFLLGGRNKADRYLKGDGVFDVDVRLSLDPETARAVYRQQFDVFLRSKLAVPVAPAAQPMTPEEERNLQHAYQSALSVNPEERAVPEPAEISVARGAYVTNRGKRAGVTRAIEALIGEARQQVILANAYFIPNAAQRALLTAKLKDGLFLGVFSNSRTSTNHTGVVRLMEGVVSRLLFYGMRIYQHLGGEVHAKTSSADGRYTVIGAANLDPRSEFLDTQNGVVLDSPEIAAAFDTAVRERQLDGRFKPYQADRFSLRDACIRLILEPWTWLQ